MISGIKNILLTMAVAVLAYIIWVKILKYVNFLIGIVTLFMPPLIVSAVSLCLSITAFLFVLGRLKGSED